MVVEAAGEAPLILDLGTGLRGLAEHQPWDGSFRAAALVTHLHWDHVQGLPFFPPVDRAGARLDIYGPAQGLVSLGETFEDLMRPPYFPVHLAELRGDIAFHDLADDDMAIGGAKVRARLVPHLGTTLGYRIELDGAVVAYVSDHQAPAGLDRVPDSVLELCDGADLLIHDAQYTPAEWREKGHWGHCTVEYAVLVAKEAGARQLALFHHDPAHDDDLIDDLLRGARCLAAMAGVAEVVAAAEGMVLELGRP